MIICDKCKRGGDVHLYCFGQAASDFPGLISRELCPNCARAFVKLIEEHTINPDEPSQCGGI